MIERYTRPEMGHIWSEHNKYDKWLKVELAVCEAWAERGVIPKDALPKLREARYNLDDMSRYFPEMHHDMTVFLRSLADSLGPESRHIHVGLTSNDVWDTGLALQLIEATELLEQGLRALTDAVREKVLEHKETICIGRTHGVHAEPTTFGLKLAAWWDELRRQSDRLTQAKKTVSVGKISGAVGTHATVPPDVEADVCGRLGLMVEPISTQIVHRDRHAHYVSTLALIAASLERFATEIRHLQRTEVLEAEEPFGEGQTGSSAMPHKRNPEKCERISGLARLFRGYASAALENVALWHERDISHSSVERVILPDPCILLDYMLDMFTGIVRGLKVYPENMRRNLEATQGVIFSQRVLLALIDKGLVREEAYKLVQRNAMRAGQERTPFLDLLCEDEEVMRHLSRDELASLFDYGIYLKHVGESFRRIGL
jgi:adenylosuccinate lyase